MKNKPFSEDMYIYVASPAITTLECEVLVFFLWGWTYAPVRSLLQVPKVQVP
jgi:hypothetical protein